MKTQNIETIRKTFKNEWLLIRVKSVKNSRPITGSILEHNQDRDTIFKHIAKYNAKYPVFVTYSQDTLPQGYAAAFKANA